MTALAGPRNPVSPNCLQLFLGLCDSKMTGDSTLTVTSLGHKCPIGKSVPDNPPSPFLTQHKCGTSSPLGPIDAKYPYQAHHSDRRTMFIYQTCRFRTKYDRSNLSSNPVHPLGLRAMCAVEPCSLTFQWTEHVDTSTGRTTFFSCLTNTKE